VRSSAGDRLPPALPVRPLASPLLSLLRRQPRDADLLDVARSQVLAIRKALSIQAHPDKKLAQRLHDEKPDVYKGALAPSGSPTPRRDDADDALCVQTRTTRCAALVSASVSSSQS